MTGHHKLEASFALRSPTTSNFDLQRDNPGHICDATEFRLVKLA